MTKLTIKRDQKRKLRNQLHSLGISRTTLYPEIEHVAIHIKQSYASVSLNPVDLTEIQRKVYQQLREGDAFSTAEIATAQGIASSASRVLSELQRRGVTVLVGSGQFTRWQLADELEVLDVSGALQACVT